MTLKGKCNRKTGMCECYSGFTGAACDQMLCPMGGEVNDISLPFKSNIPQICSGHGTCKSLRHASSYVDYVNYFQYNVYNDWDADMIHGCVCSPGWEGVACEKRSCPRGDDPMTPGQDEIQVIDCKCSTCTGGVNITWMGETVSIPYDATWALVNYKLSKLSNLKPGFILWDFTGPGSVASDTFCPATGSAVKISIYVIRSPVWQSFQLSTYGGFIPSILAVRTRGQVSSIDSSFQIGAYSQLGVGREWLECSNHGECDHSTGECTCYNGFGPSDGMGNQGRLNDPARNFKDCGHNNTLSATLRCPVANGAKCSNHGVCQPDGTCACSGNYTGIACNKLACPMGKAWFGDNVGVGHSTLAVCSGVGTCDSSTGTCTCLPGFSGNGCQYLACPVGRKTGEVCGGNGACLTLREMAPLAYTPQKVLGGYTYTTPWDADMVRGCMCDRAPSVDNFFHVDYPLSLQQLTPAYSGKSPIVSENVTHYLERFYRGPFAQTATDFTGYACESALCPRGDDPKTSTDVNEIQSIVCDTSDNTRSFTLSFRQNTTLAISPLYTTAQLEYALEQLFTIGSVSVTGVSTTAPICSPAGTQVFIEFLTEYGDLPLMSYNILPGTSGDTHIGIVISEYQKGTKEDLECSAQGICDESTGICNCMPGWGSSNGTMFAPGERGDCSYRDPLYTVS